MSDLELINILISLSGVIGFGLLMSHIVTTIKKSINTNA
ncbi:hypothetical protein ACVWY4_005563 [Bacillus mycoides]